MTLDPAMTADEQALERGLSRARMGAWALLGFAALAFAILVLELLFLLIGTGFVVALTQLDPASPLNNPGPGAASPWLVLGGVIGVVGAIQLVLMVPIGIIAFGGYNLLQLRSPRWAMAGAIACIVAGPVLSLGQLCYSWIGLIGAMVLFPAAIVAAVFAMMAVVDPAVQAGFEASARLRGMDLP